MKRTRAYRVHVHTTQAYILSLGVRLNGEQYTHAAATCAYFKAGERAANEANALLSRMFEHYGSNEARTHARVPVRNVMHDYGIGNGGGGTARGRAAHYGNAHLRPPPNGIACARAIELFVLHAHTARGCVCVCGFR